ncbi:hypothetical protein [Pseudothioclava nitratireducens]|uniref:hypothetical protein n=1 Tax=Pseudothioclava nitratireducens TaxID=1928646 RepID=UPI0023DC1CE5|nr:hypothetical protein [Defluviimonas nitratireducens]MDF1620943.1 hypothetical protein [Defluviimonas nitratireducens]
MSETTIPEVDIASSPRSASSQQEALELRLLDAEQKNLDLIKKESGQRFWIRWIAVGVGVAVILAMSALLTHLVHEVFWGPFLVASPAFAVAMLVAPITSITAITVALFVGAFRKFDDKDMETLGNGAAGAFNVFKS